MKHILHRFYIGLIILAGIGIILLATLYLLRSVLIAPHIQRFMENSIETQLGMKVTIGNIGGSYITDFEVTNVTTQQPAPTGTLVSLEFKRLRVAYNLLSLLKGLNTLRRPSFYRGCCRRLVFATLPYFCGDRIMRRSLKELRWKPAPAAR